MIKKKKTKDFLIVMCEAERKFKKLLTSLYAIRNTGWVQRGEIRDLIDGIKDIKESLITAEVIKYGRKVSFIELNEHLNLWRK